MHVRLRSAAAWSLLLSFATPLAVVAQSPFRDTSSSPYAQAIAELRAQGSVEGYSDGTFKPGATINRAEFLKIVLATRDNGAAPDARGGCFPDVGSGDWFAPWVCGAKQEGIIDGYPDGTFKPGGQITFVEAAKILANAFGQQAEGDGEWYEPFAEALETSGAIPSTIASLDARVQRGEMAEMLWRLKTKRTDRPSKALDNVRHPELTIDLSGDAPVSGASCEDLSLLIGQRNYAMPMMMEKAMMDTAAGAPMSSRAQSNADYSETNVQVAGVDEADIVKTDGTYLYMVHDNAVSIVRAEPSNAMEVLATIQPDWAVSSSDSGYGDYGSITNLYVDGDTLVVIGSGWRSMPMPWMREGSLEKRMAIYPPQWNTQQTNVTVYSLASRTSPKEVRTVSFDGNAVSTRRIDDEVTLVLQQQLPWWGPVPYASGDFSSALPTIRDSAASSDVRIACGDIRILPRVPATGMLTVATLPIGNAKAAVRHSTILANAENIYASTTHLYVAATEWRYDWTTRGGGEERTRLYRFDLDDADLPLSAQGSVPGHLLNQFSMDESGTSFRVATTVGNSWDSSRVSRSMISVLNSDLEIVGTVDDLAPGEQIYAVRFLGDRAYVVTFKKIDPLFVIDLSSPRAPKVLGKLKIPGYSDYLHPVDATHLLGFGKDATAAKEGDFAWYQGVKVALFDVSDVEHPKEIDSEIIGDRGSDSPLLHNHKALLFDADRGLLAFPVSVAQLTDAQKRGNDGSAYGSTVFQGAYVYDVSIRNGLTLKGTITHYDDPETFLKAGDWWYGGNRDIQRIIRIGEDLFTLSNALVRSHPIKNPETVTDEVRLEP